MKNDEFAQAMEELFHEKMDWKGGQGMDGSPSDDEERIVKFGLLIQ